jgi:hypothetical protein
MDSGALRLRSTTGATLEARRVRFGERYGPDRVRRHWTYEPRIEFMSVGRLPRHLADYPDAVYLADFVRPGFAPGEAVGFELPRGEAERLRAWLHDPTGASADASTALLVGLDHELDRAAVALSRLQLDALRELDASRALDQLERAPVALVVVGQQVRGGDPLGLVRCLRERPATAGVPTIVLGGDALAASAAGANEHVPLPLDGTTLVAAAARALELV